MLDRESYFFANPMRFFSRTPVRTFVIYPAIAVAWELAVNGGQLRPAYYFAPLMIWGYLQYRLCGRYRVIRGGGGPGLETPPERLVATGLYAYTRNPMYLGHMIFLIGLTLTLKSWIAAMITIGTAIWFHTRVVGDEKKLDPNARSAICRLSILGETLDTGALLSPNVSSSEFRVLVSNRNCKFETSSPYDFFLCPDCFLPVSK